MTLADELMGMAKVADIPNAPRLVNLIEDEDVHRNSIRHEDLRVSATIPEPAIGPFLAYGAKGEIICSRIEVDGRLHSRKPRA